VPAQEKDVVLRSVRARRLPPQHAPFLSAPRTCAWRRAHRDDGRLEVGELNADPLEQIAAALLRAFAGIAGV
jgi:hypothetical protein